MALVENHAARREPLVGPSGGRQGHHQSVVGDHDFGPSCAPRGAFDEAFVVMRAGGIDALAPPVRERERAAGSRQIGEPGREIPADHVAVPGRRGPARDQAEGDGAFGTGAAHAPQRFLQVQQAQIVVAALADDHPAVLDIQIGVEAVELAVDLALQVAGERADPDRPAVLFRPQAGRRDIAECLADPGAGLGDHRVGGILAVPGREGGAQRRRVVGLPRTVLRARPQQAGEPAPGLGRFHGGAAGRRRWRVFRDLRQAGPHAQRAGIGGGVCGAAEPAANRRAPRPAGSRHEGRDGGAVRIACGIEFVEQRLGRAGKRQRFLPAVPGDAAGRARRQARRGSAGSAPPGGRRRTARAGRRP